MEQTLMAELGSWNRQEQKFRELFSDDALRDREFLKMKLGEYDRLYLRYTGAVSTTDEKAMLVMLRFQRKKMERTLYPSLITRLVRRGLSKIKSMLLRIGQRQPQNNQPADYASRTIPLPAVERPSERQQVPHNHRHGRDLGRRLSKNEQKKNGQAM